MYPFSFNGFPKEQFFISNWSTVQYICSDMIYLKISSKPFFLSIVLRVFSISHLWVIKTNKKFFLKLLINSSNFSFTLNLFCSSVSDYNTKELASKNITNFLKKNSCLILKVCLKVPFIQERLSISITFLILMKFTMPLRTYYTIFLLLLGASYFATLI